MLNPPYGLNPTIESIVPSLHKAKRQRFEPLTKIALNEARSKWRSSPKTRFLMDANMEPWAVHVMRYKHFDVRECDAANLRDVDDRTVFATAWKLRRLLVTHDADFLDDRLFPFARCSGLLVLPSYGRVSMQFANLLAGACELVSKGAQLWFHTKIVARRELQRQSSDVGKIKRIRRRVGVSNRQRISTSCL